MAREMTYAEFAEKVENERKMQLVVLTDPNLPHDLTQFYRGIVAGLDMAKGFWPSANPEPAPETGNPYPT